MAEKEVRTVSVEYDIPRLKPHSALPVGSAPVERGVIPAGFVPTLERPLPPVQCEAIAKSTGAQCRRWSVIGEVYCPRHLSFAHIGRSKEKRERLLDHARLRLVYGSDNAVDTILELLEDAPAHVRLKAAESILDRVGIRGGMELSIDASVTVAVDDPAATIRARLDEMKVRLDEAEHRTETPEELKDVIDAEIVEIDDRGRILAPEQVELAVGDWVRCTTLDAEWGTMKIVRGPSRHGDWRIENQRGDYRWKAPQFLVKVETPGWEE